MRLNPAFDERRRAFVFLGITCGVGFLFFWALTGLFLILAYLIGESFDAASLSRMGQFFHQILHQPTLILTTYIDWFGRYLLHEPLHTTWASFFAWKIPLIPLALYVLWCFAMVGYNPYEYAPQYFGTGRVARASDIKKMGLFKGKYIYIGNFKGRPLHMTETRSGFCIAAPNEGKTAGVVIPNILTADNCCLFIHDPKGELAAKTSGYRATIGPTFLMDLSLSDKPQEGVFYPCWNPLNEDNMPPQHAGRDGYIDTLIDFLIPDGPEGTDPYWVKAGRACLIGLTIYMTNKVEQAKANDYFWARLCDQKMDAADWDVLESYYKSMQPTEEVKKALMALKEKHFTKENYVPVGTWAPLPRNWIGREASFGMLLDLLNNWMFAKTIELRKKRDAGDIGAVSLDIWQVILDAMVEETFYYGYSHRGLLELNQVLALPDKQRSSVISMAQSGIEMFKNSAIRNRTSSNDFTYKDLRGIKNPTTGKYEPITIYFNNEGGSVCNLFINMMTGYLLGKGPNEGDLGPYPAFFILDDFGRMPSLQCISDGITFGRAKQNMFLVIVQDWHQIISKYGDNTTDVVLNSVGVKIIKRQNNPETHKRLLGGLAKQTKWRAKGHSREEGYGKNVNPFYHKGGYQYIEDGVIGGGGLQTMALGKQTVLLTGFYHRPMQLGSPLYFKDDVMKKKSSMAPASPIPLFVQERKLKGEAPTLDMQLDVLAE